MTGEVLAEEGDPDPRPGPPDVPAASTGHIESVRVSSHVFGNGMVNVDDFRITRHFAEDLGIKEKVRFTVLKEIIESGISATSSRRPSGAHP